MLHEVKVAAIDKLLQIFGTNHTKQTARSCGQNNQQIITKNLIKMKHETVDSVPMEGHLYLEFRIMQ